MVEVMKIMEASFKRSHAYNCYTPCSQSCSRPPLTHTSPADSWTFKGKSGSVSCGVTAPFFWVLVHKVLFVPSKSLCKFWQLYGGVNDNLLQEGLCHTQVPLRRG